MSLKHPVTTRTEDTASSGLAAGIAALSELAPPGLVLEAETLQDFGPTRAAVKAAGRPVIAIVGAPFGDEGSPTAPLDAPSPAEADAAGNGLIETLGHCKTLSCRRVIVPTSDTAFEGDAESAVDALCRRVHHLARLESAVTWSLLPSAQPAALLSPERLEWLLDDVPASNVGLTLDLGVLGLRQSRGGASLETWLDRFAGRLDLLLVSDMDGARCDLPAGMGSLDLAGIGSGLSAALPRVLRGTRDLPASVTFEQADRHAGDWFGPPPDMMYLA